MKACSSARHWLSIVLISGLAACGGGEDPSTPKGGDANDSGGKAAMEDDEHEGPSRPVGSVTAAGSTIDVSFSGKVKGGEELHVDLTVTDGPKPKSLRLWYGIESSVGSTKGKASKEGAGYHAHVMVPGEIPDGSQLWVQVEPRDGAKEARALDL